jgi:hypothetical protein
MARDFRFVTVGSQPSVNPAELTWADCNPSGGQDYFVDINMTTASTAGAKATRDATVDGKTWATAFQLLSSAITASDASIGFTANRWWARRNRIFVCGDEVTESLTVLPEKTDIIGVGFDLFPFPRVFGNHTIAVAKKGVRFVNMGFVTTGTGICLSIPAGSHGFQMIDCFAHPGTTSTKFLEITDSAHVRLINNRITVGSGSMSVIFGVGIAIAGTASIHDLVIQGNQITATLGITVANGTLMGSLICDNYIRATGLTITDASGDCQLINNRLITDVDIDGDVKLGVTSTPELACGNIVSGSGTTETSDWYPWAKVSA